MIFKLAARHAAAQDHTGLSRQFEAVSCCEKCVRACEQPKSAQENVPRCAQQHAQLQCFQLNAPVCAGARLDRMPKRPLEVVIEASMKRMYQQHSQCHSAGAQPCVSNCWNCGRSTNNDQKLFDMFREQLEEVARQTRAATLAEIETDYAVRNGTLFQILHPRFGHR